MIKIHITNKSTISLSILMIFLFFISLYTYLYSISLLSVLTYKYGELKYTYIKYEILHKIIHKTQATEMLKFCENFSLTLK